jgi:hypothetical protein
MYSYNNIKFAVVRLCQVTLLIWPASNSGPNVYGFSIHHNDNPFEPSRAHQFVRTLMRRRNGRNCQRAQLHKRNIASVHQSDVSVLTPDTQLLTRSNNSTKDETYMTDIQIIALTSKISKFIVTISDATAIGTGSKGSPDQSEKAIVLWRNLLDDTPELTGFPISFLSEQVISMIRDNHPSIIATLENFLSRKNVNDTFIAWDMVVPYLDAYTFEGGGGVNGLVYGVTGVADGTLICTTPVGDLQTTILRNYIQTGDGCIYELGRPSFVSDPAIQTTKSNQPYSLAGTTKQWFRDGKLSASSMVNNLPLPNVDDKSSDFANNPELIQLAGLTTVVLFGAAAMESLSHHLTINVFWV